MGILIKNGEIITAADRFVGDVYCADGLIQAVGRGLEATGELLGAGARAIGHAHAAQPLSAQRLERELDHLARSHQQRALVVEALEHLAGQVHRHARHRDRPGRHPGLRAHALGGREGELEEPAEDRSAGPAQGRGAPGVLHLPEDLRLAHHHRIERGGHAQHVPLGVRASVLVEVRIEVRRARGRAMSITPHQDSVRSEDDGVVGPVTRKRSWWTEPGAWVEGHQGGGDYSEAVVRRWSMTRCQFRL